MIGESQRTSLRSDALLCAPRSRASCVAAVLFGLLATAPRAQGPETGTVALRQAIRDLGTDTRALLVTSHPDDLYLLLGAYLRYAKGWRVEVALLTRGEGGQNLMGSETGDDLRRLRTLETEAAAERLGLKLWYANLPDRGYCRTAEEAFADWGRRETTSRIAQAIRSIRPDVVMTTLHPQELHGHDLALLEALPAAVELAAEPSARGLTGSPFRVERVFRAAAPGKKAVRPEERDLPAEQSELYLPLDEIESVRGETYRRLAYRVLEEEHKTQIPIESITTLFPNRLGFVSVPVFGRGAERGDVLVETLSGYLPAIFPAIRDRSERLELRTRLEQTLPAVSSEPSRFLTEALAVRRQLREVALEAPDPAEAERRRVSRLEALDRAIISACGVRIVPELPRAATAVYGEPFAVTLRVHTGPTRRIAVTGITVPADLRATTSDVLPIVLEPHESAGIPLQIVASNGPGRPDPFRSDRYEPPLRFDVAITIDGETLRVPVALPTEVRPALELSVTPRNLLLPSGVRHATFAVRVRKNAATPFKGKFRVVAPTSWVVARQVGDVTLDQEVLKDFTFDLTLPELFDDGATSITVQLGEARAALRAQRLEVEVDRTNTVGLVRGADDAAESALRGLAVPLRTLGDEDLVLGSLDDLKTIVVDIRALRLRESARAAFDRLLRFAENGGRLVVLYHKDVEFNLDVAHFRGAPYPLRIGKGRVTNEHAPVSVLLPEHPLLNIPNKIREQDWDGWVQERGLYFAESFDDHYQPLLAMRDSEALPLEKGSLLYATSGKGDYVYCALALFRQWKALHPGACRLLANLVTPRQ